MSKEKSGKINSDEEYGSDDELITSQLGDLDLNSSGSKSSPSVVRSTPTNSRTTPVAVRPGSKGSQSGSVNSKENTPSRTSSRTSNYINPITSRESMGSLGSLGSAAMGSDEELREQDDRFILQNRWTQEQLQENQTSSRPGTSLGFGPGVGLTSGSVFDQQKTIDMSGKNFQEIRKDKERGYSLSTLEEAPSEDEMTRSGFNSAQSSRAPSRTGSFASFTSFGDTPTGVKRKKINKNKRQVDETITETSVSASEKDSDNQMKESSSGEHSPGKSNNKFVPVSHVSKKRKGRDSSPVSFYRPLPQNTDSEQLVEEIYDIWYEKKEDYKEDVKLDNKLKRESRKKKPRVEAAGAGDENIFEEEELAYTELMKDISEEVDQLTFTGISTLAIFFEWMQFWLYLYYNINTNFEHRQKLIKLLVDVRNLIQNIGATTAFSGNQTINPRSLILFLPFIDEVLEEAARDQNFYNMSNLTQDDKMKGGKKKRKTRKRKPSKKTSRKTAKRNVKSKPKRKAPRKIKLTRKKKATTKKRKFIKTKRSLKTNKKIQTRKR